MTESLADEMRATSTSLPHDESEFDHVGIEQADAKTVTPPRVADALVHMECTLYDSLRVYDNCIILGEVQHFQVADELLTGGKIDMRKVETIGRAGGPYYTRLDPIEY